MCVCNCLKHFISSIVPELIIIENSGCGNYIYLFVKENFLLLVIFSEIVSTHTNDIKSLLQTFLVYWK